MTIKGHVTYSLSPFNQKLFPNFLKNGWSYTMGGMRSQWKYFTPAIIFGCTIYFGAEALAKREHDKHKF